MARQVAERAASAAVVMAWARMAVGMVEAVGVASCLAALWVVVMAQAAMEAAC